MIRPLSMTVRPIYSVEKRKMDQSKKREMDSRNSVAMRYPIIGRIDLSPVLWLKNRMRESRRKGSHLKER